MVRVFPWDFYEAQPEAGGMLRCSIPAYRLPRATLDAEIAVVEQLVAELSCQRMELGVPDDSRRQSGTDRGL